MKRMIPSSKLTVKNDKLTALEGIYDAEGNQIIADGGSLVVGNPEGTATATLSKISIQNDGEPVVYNIVGVPEVFMQDLNIGYNSNDDESFCINFFNPQGDETGNISATYNEEDGNFTSELYFSNFSKIIFEEKVDINTPSHFLGEISSISYDFTQSHDVNLSMLKDCVQSILGSMLVKFPNISSNSPVKPIISVEKIEEYEAGETSLNDVIVQLIIPFMYFSSPDYSLQIMAIDFIHVSSGIQCQVHTKVIA